MLFVHIYNKKRIVDNNKIMHPIEIIIIIILIINKHNNNNNNANVA